MHVGRYALRSEELSTMVAVQALLLWVSEPSYRTKGWAWQPHQVAACAVAQAQQRVTPEAYWYCNVAG